MHTADIAAAAVLCHRVGRITLVPQLDPGTAFRLIIKVQPTDHATDDVQYQ